MATDAVELPPKRGTWGKQLEFTFSCIGYAVGLGNLWRFPYLCMRNGGGAFLIPYFIFLMLCGIPLFLLELCLGQFSSLSPVSVWAICPLFKGIGWGMVIVSSVMSIYFVTPMAWSLYYFGMSLRSDVPWRSCTNEWNTAGCYVLGENKSAVTNSTAWDSTTAGYSVTGQPGNVTVVTGNVTVVTMSAAEEFWSYKVLGLSDGIENLGTIKWDLALALLGTWILVFLCLSNGIKSSGKVVYITATLPYVLLTALLVRGVTLPGSYQGIKFYIIPDWQRLGEFKVWTDACLQVFYSLGPAWGGLITMSSYNKFNNNCYIDAVVVCFTCGGSSLFAGFAIFSILGYMAHQSGVSVDKVVTQGPGLAFVAYPEAIGQLPASPFWAVCFFVTIFCLGIDGQFGMLETVISGLADEFQIKRKNLFGLLICIFMFIIGLPFVTNGGMYLFQVLDWYSAAFSVMVIGFCECFVIGYVYGISRFYKDMTMMFKKKPSILWAICWCGITPLLMMGMLVVSAWRMVPPTYGDYIYPNWAIGLGWVLAVSSMIPIPGYMVYILCKTEGTLRQRLHILTRPTHEWCPKDDDMREMYMSSQRFSSWVTRMRIVSSPSEKQGLDAHNENHEIDTLKAADL